MNTARGLTKVVLKSRRISAWVAGIAVGGLAIVVGIRRSAHLFDDMLFGCVVGVICLVVYLQPDWAVRHVEQIAPRDVLFRIPTRERLAALTIDDVPLLNNPTHLEEILNVLLQNKVKATFFIMSGFDLEVEQGGMHKEQRERCNRLLQRAVDEGHELANHLQFDRPAIAMEPAAFDAAFLHCDALLERFAGGKTAWHGRPRRWFRPASAMWNDHILSVARKHGYTTAISNCFPYDTAQATRRLNAPYLRLQVRPGAIIIVHDRWHTPSTLAKALPEILASGLRLGTLSELYAAADPHAAEAIPVARNTIDIGNGDTFSRTSVSGVDLNRDGIIDALQQDGGAVGDQQLAAESKRRRVDSDRRPTPSGHQRRQASTSNDA